MNGVDGVSPFSQSIVYEFNMNGKKYYLIIMIVFPSLRFFEICQALAKVTGRHRVRLVNPIENSTMSCMISVRVIRKLTGEATDN